MAVFSSRRKVEGDVWGVKRDLREELAWLVGVEGDVGVVERWIEMGREMVTMGGGGGRNREVRVGQWRDENGRDVKRELRAEMFI